MKVNIDYTDCLIILRNPILINFLFSFDFLFMKFSTFPGATSSLRESPLFVPELKKQDSFEGHEAAVRSLVEAVHESRKLEAKQRKKSEG